MATGAGSKDYRFPWAREERAQRSVQRRYSIPIFFGLGLRVNGIRNCGQENQRSNWRRSIIAIPNRLKLLLPIRVPALKLGRFTDTSHSKCPSQFGVGAAFDQIREPGTIRVEELEVVVAKKILPYETCG